MCFDGGLWILMLNFKLILIEFKWVWLDWIKLRFLSLIFVGFVSFCLVLNLRPSPQSRQPIQWCRLTQTQPLLRPVMTQRRKVRRGATYKRHPSTLDDLAVVVAPLHWMISSCSGYGQGLAVVITGLSYGYLWVGWSCWLGRHDCRWRMKNKEGRLEKKGERDAFGWFCIWQV